MTTRESIDTRTIPYSFAVLHVVPHVHVGTCSAIAVVLHAPTERFVGMRALTDVAMLARRTPDVDAELLRRYLTTYQAACDADVAAGALALGSPSERFHWLTAPRSDVIQSGAVHEGVCADPVAELDALFNALVRP